MAWSDESVSLLRAVILDDESPYEYSDARLRHIFVVSFFQVYQQVKDRLRREYAADTVNDAITPDPAGTSLTDPDRDEPLLNMAILKSACMLQQGAARKAAMTDGFALKDKDAFIDTRGKVSALVELLKSGRSYCTDYDNALRDFLIDAIGTAAAAVIGPYRYGGAAGGDRRPASGGGRKYFG